MRAALASHMNLRRMQRPGYSPLTDPAVLAWFAPDATGVYVERKGNLAVSLAGTTPMYSATSLGGYPGVTFAGAGGSRATCAGVGPLLAGKTRVGFACAFRDALPFDATAPAVISYSSGAGSGQGAMNLHRNFNSANLSTISRDSLRVCAWQNYGKDYPYTSPHVVTAITDFGIANGNCLTERLMGMPMAGTLSFDQGLTGTISDFTLSMGAYGGGGNPWAGTLGDVVVFDASGITETQIRAIEQFIGARAGLFNLPVPDGFRYMPFGDSNTRGSSDVGEQVNCWRNRLSAWLLASSAWPNALSVGEEQLNPPSPANARGLWHQGVAGSALAYALTVEDALFATTSKHNINLTILSHGTNDANSGRTPTQYADDYKTLVAAILADRPRMRFVFVGIPFMNSGVEPAAALLDAQWAATLIPYFAAQGVVFAHTSLRGATGPGDGVGWNATDFVDNYHFSATGAEKVFNLVRDALMQVLGAQT